MSDQGLGQKIRLGDDNVSGVTPRCFPLAELVKYDLPSNIQQFSFCLAFHLNRQDINVLAHRSRPLPWTPAVQESA
jgi:hypothetical protein